MKNENDGELKLTNNIRKTQDGMRNIVVRTLETCKGKPIGVAASKLNVPADMLMDYCNEYNINIEKYNIVDNRKKKDEFVFFVENEYPNFLRHLMRRFGTGLKVENPKGTKHIINNRFSFDWDHTKENYDKIILDTYNVLKPFAIKRSEWETPPKRDTGTFYAQYEASGNLVRIWISRKDLETNSNYNIYSIENFFKSEEDVVLSDSYFWRKYRNIKDVKMNIPVEAPVERDALRGNCIKQANNHNRFLLTVKREDGSVGFEWFDTEIKMRIYIKENGFKSNEIFDMIEVLDRREIIL